MRWRGKLLFMMIVYAAGFLTAIYVLAPTNGQAAGSDGTVLAQDEATQRIDLQRWAASARVGMTKAVSFAEEQALRLADKIKSATEQSTPD